MNKNHVRYFLFAFMAFSLQLSAQKLTVDKVYSVKLRGSGTIQENEQIKGYYFLYQSDKIDKKTNEYTLQILDENLKNSKDIKFTDSKDVVLLESSYNGDAISFLFYNDEENTLDYRLYNMEGKQTYTYTKILDKKSEAYFKQALKTSSSEESENKNVFDIPKKGFLSITPLRENKKYTYDINFYSSAKKKSWTYDPLEDGKFTQAQYLGANDSIALVEVLSKEKLMSKEVESTILGISLATGKKVFEVRTQDGKHQLYPMNIYMLKDQNEFLITGLYYEGTERIMQDKSQGLGIWMMDNKGKIVRSKYMSWTKDLGKHLTVNEKGRIEDMGYVYIHKLMQTEDGKIFAIGEGYKKVADGVGIALNILTQSYSAGVTKLKVTNMMMLELSKDFDLTKAKIYEKNSNNFSLGTGSDFSSPHSLALFAKAYGAFDYNYTQMGKNNASFNSAYTDYEKSKGYKGMVFHSINYNEGKITTDQINLKSEASQLVILPGKPGTVLLIEYFKKDKKLEFRMEKLNS
ncbi:hypothetical protein HRH25_05985 [Flavisolibacter sp. BT320]|nr:hypothetical protein [Flavisolibacter longurius]